MQNEINSITQQLFHRELNDVSEGDLQEFVFKYPYAAPARFLLAKKKFDNDPAQVSDDIITAGLYFSNPLWLNKQLTHSEPVETVEVAPVPEPEAKAEEPASDIVFQSYHTIDYFASQGIRLQQADFTKDKLGQQLKSFTEWLKSMKKLPNAEVNPAGPEDVSRQQAVIQTAAHSIEEKEVVTEAMAEVWIKQGHNDKAIDIFNKLSLQNPSKSAYFAAKIEQLK